MRYGPLKNTRCRSFAAWIVLATLLLLFQSALAREAPRVLLLASQETEPYTQTIAAFKEQLRQNQPQAEFMYHLVDTTAMTSATQFMPKGTNLPPDIIFTLGSSATETAQKIFPSTPVLATMILQESALEQKTNNAGILLQFPVEIQLQWVQKFLPHVKRIGILYNPVENSHWIIEAEKAARAKNIQIVPFEVTSPKKLQTGLKYISRNADVLLAIPDQEVYSGKTAKEVLLFSYRNHIPFIGLSSSWVKAGALYALEVDYRDLGRQAGELAGKILAGTSPAEKHIFHPDRISYSLNTRTLEYLRLEITDDLIKGAAKLFE